MADRAKKTRATATPKQGSAKDVKLAEVAKPISPVRKGIELVVKAQVPQKATIAAAKPSKTATKKESVVAITQTKVVSREMIEQVAYQNWIQRGYSMAMH